MNKHSDSLIKQFLKSTSQSCNLEIVAKIHDETFNTTLNMLAQLLERSIYWRIFDAINDE